MFELLKDFGLKVLGHVAPLVLAWFYSPEKIAADIKLRIRGESDGVTYEGGELPSVRIWIRASNLSPFNVEVDRLVFRLYFGASYGEWSDVRRRKLGASKEQEWLLEAALTERQLSYIQRKSLSEPETRLTLTAFVNSSLHRFETTVETGTGNVRFLNMALPSA